MVLTCLDTSHISTIIQLNCVRSDTSSQLARMFTNNMISLSPHDDASQFLIRWFISEPPEWGVSNIDTELWDTWSSLSTSASSCQDDGGKIIFSQTITGPLTNKPKHWGLSIKLLLMEPFQQIPVSSLNEYGASRNDFSNQDHIIDGCQLPHQN